VHVTSFFENLPFSFLSALIWVLIAFAVGTRVHRNSTIDVFWGSGFLVIMLESMAMSLRLHPHGTWLRYLVLFTVALWSLRLSIHIGRRQVGAKEDTRYVDIMAGANGRNERYYAFKMIYGLQGLLLWFVSMPLQWIAFSAHLNGLLVPGLILCAIGIFFEGVGDEQLRRFLANPANKGTTMNRGLWRYTRHPNYFGDAVTWAGFYVIAIGVPWGALTFLSPITMWWLLTNLSGKPMLEKKLSTTRKGYHEYIATTSSFFPRPPKKLADV
jgi:steroid 5-alpha reductase family enzyme